jgi:hypothetical protein
VNVSAWVWVVVAVLVLGSGLAMAAAAGETAPAAAPAGAAPEAGAKEAAPAAAPVAAAPGFLFSEGFEDADLLKRGWYDGTKFKISTENPYAGKGCIEFHWNAGTTTPESSSGARHPVTPTDPVYLRYYIRLSKGWGWSGRTYHPHLSHFMTTENPPYHGPASSHLTTYLEPVNGKLRLALTDMQNADAPHGLTQGPLKGGYNGKEYDSAQVLFNDDQWHCVEAMYKLNSVDVAKSTWARDGVIKGWFDGKLVVDRNDIVLRTVDYPNMKFNQFLLTPYFGQGLLPHEQTLWIDELVVSSEPIGPMEKPTAKPAAEGAQAPASSRP